MREAAERRQQLELELEQALATLRIKQQEIQLLQKAQVEAKREHEGAVRLLESKVQALELQCRVQSEQFRLLSRALGQFRQHSAHIQQQGSPAPSKTCPALMNGLAASLGRGPDVLGGRSVLGDYLRPLPLGPPEPLSLGPAFLPRPTSPGCGFEADQMERERSASPSRRRYSGKVHLCVARYSYNPFDGPNENPEAELPLAAGKYLYVYGDMDEDGFYEGELLDGQRGLVPSNFVDFVQDPESRPGGLVGSGQDQSLESVDLEGSCPPSPPCPEPGAPELPADMDASPAEGGEDAVPHPRAISLIKQLAKSVIVGWEPPALPPGAGALSGYAVLVDQQLRLSLAPGSRPRALLEKLDLASGTHRVCVQSLTGRGASDPLRCTLQVGRDVVVAPSGLRAARVTQSSALLSWQPADSNYRHAVFLGEQELGEAPATRYTYPLLDLRPGTAYRVRLLARPHQTPWQLPLEQRERREAWLDFHTLPTGPPAPPQDIVVHMGPTPTSLLVSWKPPVLTAGLSNGAVITGYGVYTKGQRVAELPAPGDSVLVELSRLRGLEAAALTVRSLWAQGESEDSVATQVPPHLLAPPTPAPAPTLGRTLEPPAPAPGRRSPSPSRILPQPRGAPMSSSAAKAMAREAAQRVAESSRLEQRSTFLERGRVHSDEEDGGSPDTQRRAVSVDDFLRGSELGKQPHSCLADEYHTESSRGSDLSDILEEDEEELCSEMQLEDGRRRPSGTSHSALKILGNPASGGRVDRLMDGGWRLSRSPGATLRHRAAVLAAFDDYEGGRLSPDPYEESETEPGADEPPARVFVALFDYDPLTMSPNPDAAEEELPFKEGQIIKVYGDKDVDGFYRGETCARLGLIPCNMVSEIRADDEEVVEQLLRQGFLPLSTPVEKTDKGRRPGRRRSPSTRRMVALYDYDPRESSPNVDVEAELTFCTGDIISVFGDIDEDGFYYGELNGQKGLVPSNFLEEVPDDVQVYLSEVPMRPKAKRVPPEGSGTARRAPSPTARLHAGSPPASVGTGSPGRGRDMSSRKKKGLLSKGKKLLKRLGAVK